MKPWKLYALAPSWFQNDQLHMLDVMCQDGGQRAAPPRASRKRFAGLGAFCPEPELSNQTPTLAKKALRHGPGNLVTSLTSALRCMRSSPVFFLAMAGAVSRLRQVGVLGKMGRS